MGKEQITTYVCDACGKKVECDKMPVSASDPWGTLIIKQTTTVSHNGNPWTERMKEPIILCSKCIEVVANALNSIKKEQP